MVPVSNRVAVPPRVRVDHHAVQPVTVWLDGTMAAALAFVPALSRPDLLAAPVAAALSSFPGSEEIEVAQIDPALADTAAFCEHYGVSPAQSANCVVVAARRAGQTTYAACMVAATTRADVNGLVRKHLDARKASFAPVAAVTAATGMEYGGITPVGLPEGWPVLVDEAVAKTAAVVIGSGIRGSKLRLPGRLLAALPAAQVLPGLGLPAA
jgi:prolyl-tRNA editing enzyme YbaK/EbsC (Cys-tRNA(Pro) deacylase)